MRKRADHRKPRVGIIMGSHSDLETMKGAAEVLEQMAIPYEMRVVSAHRTPELMAWYATTAHARGLKVIIAGAGGAAHLPGMTAAYTTLPVIGVPVASSALKGVDAFLSMAQLPPGAPVAVMAIGDAEAAGRMAARILALKEPAIAQRLQAHGKAAGHVEPKKALARR